MFLNLVVVLRHWDFGRSGDQKDLAAVVYVGSLLIQLMGTDKRWSISVI